MTIDTSRRRPARKASDERVLIGPREQIFHLLAEAAEIEHTLMCTYLYAAFSLKSGAGSDLSKEEATLVEQWRKSILAVAIEEMVHLVLVSNLAVAVGGRPHLGRPNLPIAPGYFPSGVVVKLAPFCKATLDHFVFLERPAAVRVADGEGFDAQTPYRRQIGRAKLMPSVQDYSTVGHLYEALARNLRASAERLGEKALFIGVRSAQLGPAVLGMPGVREITDLKSALKAIDSIIEQGEGSAAHRDDSHYQRFLTIQTQYAEASRRNREFEPAWPVATSPVMRLPAKRSGTVFVSDPHAAAVLDLANALYCLLLRCLTQAFGRTGRGARAAQGLFITVAIELMHMLATVAGVVAQMPADATGRVNAGVSFTMLRGNEPFFGGASERHIFGERLEEIAKGAESMRPGRIFKPMARKLLRLRGTLDRLPKGSG